MGTRGQEDVSRTAPWAHGETTPPTNVWKNAPLGPMPTIPQESVWQNAPRMKASMLICGSKFVLQLAPTTILAARSTRSALRFAIWATMETRQPHFAPICVQSRSTPMVRMLQGLVFRAVRVG